VSDQLPELDPLRSALGVSIEDEPLRHALTHSTWAYENGGENNERLEFLGDAVLGQSVTSMLFRQFPDLPEGELAKRRAAIVSTTALAGVAQSLQLGDYLRLGRGEQLTDGRNKPSLLADAIEAIIGAVYLAAGPSAADELVQRLFRPIIEHPDTFVNHSDPKTALQEWLQSAGLPTARYELRGEGPDHSRTFTAQVYIDHPDFASGPIAEGVGSSKKNAEIQAAAAALASLHGA